MPINPVPGHFSTSQYKSTLFETNMACIENIAKIQHRQLNYLSLTCHNCAMLIKTFDLWWLKQSEVTPNPASIPSATSLAHQWLAEAIIVHSIFTLSGWLAGGQGQGQGGGGWGVGGGVGGGWGWGWGVGVGGGGGGGVGGGVTNSVIKVSIRFFKPGNQWPGYCW